MSTAEHSALRARSTQGRKMEVDSPGSPSADLHNREFQCSGFLAAAPEALCCGREQFEVQRGDLSGASVELRTAGGLG